MRRLLSLVAVLSCAAAAHASHVPGCNTNGCDTRAKKACWASDSCRTRVIRKQWHRVADPYWGIFEAIARCESGGNWHIRGYFSGGIQFLDSSWHEVGGTGRAADHSKLEQIYRGVLLMRKQGWGAWPVCRRTAGV